MDIISQGRSALFSPVDRPDRAAKALAGTADIVILDLEDAVAPDNKESARGHLREILSATPDRPGIVIRINDPATTTGQSDLETLRELANTPDGAPFALMIPKLSRSTPLSELPAATPVIGLIETAAAVRDIHEIAALPQITRLALGAVDLSTELGCDPASATIEAVRAQLVLASAAAGLVAPLDSPCVNFRDPAVVEESARRARRDGFGGLLCIHPAQLPAVSTAFRPTPEELLWARKVLAVGESAAAVDGEMVDRPVLLRARQLINAAEA